MRRTFLTWRHRFTKSLTLRWRLTLWVAGLFLVLGLGLVVLINSMAAVRVPQAISVVLMPTEQPLSEPSVASPSLSLDATPPPFVETSDTQIEQVQAIAIREVHSISLIGVGIFALLGAVGAYWIAQRALRPVRHLSHLTQEIQIKTLHQRLPIDGPPDEIQELTNAFNEMLERLEHAFEQQSRFVSDAAHELRTPLTTLRTNLEVVQTDPNAKLEDYREMSDALERALTRLERLVADLLLLAQGERKVANEEIALGPLMEEVLLDLTPLATEKKVSLRLEGASEIMVRGDGSLLACAFGNLVENGIYYNRPGGEVVVTMLYDRNWIVITVTDTGVGIPPEEQAHIFDRFYRVDRSRSRHKGGAGLGLSIVAHIVQLHGGQVRVESTSAVGSTFTVQLPL